VSAHLPTVEALAARQITHNLRDLELRLRDLADVVHRARNGIAAGPDGDPLESSRTWYVDRVAQVIREIHVAIPNLSAHHPLHPAAEADQDRLERKLKGETS
jgi:hypothetical protein